MRQLSIASAAEEYQDLLPRTQSLSDVKQLEHELGIAPSIVLDQALRVTGEDDIGQVDPAGSVDSPMSLRVGGSSLAH